MATTRDNKKRLGEGNDFFSSSQWANSDMSGIDTLLGLGGNDSLYGDGRANTLEGGSGNDYRTYNIHYKL